MTITIIWKKDIKELLRGLAAGKNVYVPQKIMGDDVCFAPLPKEGKELETALNNVSLEDVDTVVPPKDIFFPQLESMFEFKDGGIKETTEPAPALIFGIRSCDLKGLLFADDFFKRNFDDAYYLNRIKDRFIVVIGCIKPPRAACFCASADTGPFAENGFDLQFIDGGDFYFAEAGSKMGEAFISGHKIFFQDAPEKDIKTINQIKAKARSAVELKVDFKKAIDLMSKDDFIPEENYRRIGERCIYCGACLYSCPTCTCFNVFDTAKDAAGQRLRTWDACIFEGYTREASGHNPRRDKWHRTSRRYEHKLKYDHKKTGMSGCVACGRCLSGCPVNIGMSKFIQEITEGKKVM